MMMYEQMTKEELVLELRRRDELVQPAAAVEDPYRTSLMLLRDAFFISEIIYDDSGAPCDYRYLDVNAEYEKIVGLPREEIVNRTFKEVVPRHTHLWFRFSVFHQVVTSGISSYCSYYCETFGRELEIFAFTPAVNRYAVVVRDITERKKADQALRESEARLRFFIEHAPASLAMFDREMRYLCASRRWVEQYKLIGRDLIGHVAYEVIPGISQEWRDVHRRSLCGEVFSCDGERFTLNGHDYWVSWKIQPWYDASGAIGGIVIFSEDISVLKEAEEALRNSEQRYRDIVENQTEYVDRYLPGGILTFVNSSLAAFAGLKPEQLLGKSFYPFLHEDDRAEAIAAIESLTADNRTVVLENRALLPDGMHWMQWKHHALTDGDGNVVEYQASGRDITELRQMQEALLKHQSELRQVNESLEQRVRERTADLEAAISAQESFSYSVSHDFRAPLRHINSFSSMLVEDFGDSIPPQARDYLDRICAASSRMGALIDHLLELARVTRAVITPSLVDLSEVAGSVLRMFQETEPGRRAEIRIEKGVTAMGDPSLLRQLLENLLGNAWKYTGKTASPRIEFGRNCASGQEVYFVKDNGAGFDMQYSEKLFNAFERLHGPEFEGLGIGLATAQRIIQRHGGTIWAEGAVGQGATFYFTLPA